MLTIFAVSTSCQPPEDSVVPNKRAGTTLFLTKANLSQPALPAALDVFVYDDDERGGLDSWRHFDSFPRRLELYSGPGVKQLFVVAGASEREWTIPQTGTLSDIRSFSFSLSEEDPERPLVYGEAPFLAGGNVSLNLEPLLSRIVLRRLSCDFSGTTHEGESLENVCAYLINVSGTASASLETPSRRTVFNSTRLSRQDLDAFAHPEMLYHEIGTVDSSQEPLDLEFFCYPNILSEESLGQEFTRLVVQGELGGRTYYYPVNINQEGFGYSCGPKGIDRNVSYMIDLKITREGSDDPDVPVPPSVIDTEGWIELHPGEFLIGHDGEELHIWCDLYPEDTPLDICVEDLEYDRERGIYDYRFDSDGHGVTLRLKKGGTGMFTIDAGPPVNTGYLIIVVVNP